MPIAEQSEEGQDRLTERAGHLLLHNLPACSIYQRLDCTLATIGHGHDFDLHFRVDISHTLCNSFSGLRRCEAAFERLRSNDDTHACTSMRMEEMVQIDCVYLFGTPQDSSPPAVVRKRCFLWAWQPQATKPIGNRREPPEAARNRAPEQLL